MKIRTMKLREAHKSGECSSLCSVLWASDGDHIVTASSSDNAICIHDAITPSNALKFLRNHREGVTALAISPNSTCLASGSIDHSVKLYKFPERPGEPECSFFLKTGDCKYKSNCKFHSPKNRLPKAKAIPNSYVLNDKGLPLRPDQPICTHYHRYGICKFVPACKYDHSSNSAIASTPFDSPPYGNLNSMGL